MSACSNDPLLSVTPIVVCICLTIVICVSAVEDAWARRAEGDAPDAREGSPTFRTLKEGGDQPEPRAYRGSDVRLH